MRPGYLIIILQLCLTFEVVNSQQCFANTTCTTQSNGDGKCIPQALCQQPSNSTFTSTACIATNNETYSCCPELVEVTAKPRVAKRSIKRSANSGRGRARSITKEELAKINFTTDLPVCSAQLYRSIDGSCNNLQNGNWGKSFYPFRRLLPHKYTDGISSPRVATDGSPLPSARLVSQLTIPDEDRTNIVYALLTMQWAQFLDHDFALAPTPTDNNCCISTANPECFPISIPADDAFYSQYNHTCIEFVRSVPFPRPNSTLPRDQFDALTSYIDGSMIYGSTNEKVDILRLFRDGLLATWNLTRNNSDTRSPPANIPFGTGEFLPRGSDEFCGKQPIQGNICFEAGDERVNEQPALTAMHTLWLREHNRLARGLFQLNPSWSDEILFQEARKIVIAEIQHITYNEFLPIILGPNLMTSKNIALLNTGFSTSYDSSLDATIGSAFATAAYRFGHTLLQPSYKVKFQYEACGYNYSLTERHRLRDDFFNPQYIPRPRYLEGFFKALHKNGAQTFDKFVTAEVTEHLFQGDMPFGMDLVALNIQRSRDHGIGTYNDFREFCGLGRANTFDDFINVIAADQIEVFKQLYKNVNDVDLFPAGVSEKSMDGAILGPTFGCIIAEQYARLKFGDRFFYENGNQVSSFTLEQLNEIRKVTLSKVICTNTDVESIQPKAFFLSTNPGNEEVLCTSILPSFDLSKWKISTVTTTTITNVT